jgi:hypothetical protein
MANNCQNMGRAEVLRKRQYALPAAGIASLVKRRFFYGVTKEQMFASLWPSQGLTSIKDQRGK